MIQENASSASSEDTPAEPESSDQEQVLTYDDRRYRVRGMEKNTSYDQLKVNLMVSRDGLMHVDSLDLYMARPRSTFIKRAAAELYVDTPTIKKDVGRVILALEEQQQAMIRKAQDADTETPYVMSDAEEAEAHSLLRSPRLLEQILNDFDACGVVGEQNNKLVGYLATVSRKLDDPLGVIIQSSSAAGKTSLLDAVLAFVPPEEQVSCSAMTGQSLFYMGKEQLKHKVLAIAEDVGVEQASYALKLLQSDGRLTIATTGKNRQTGRMATEQYQVEGPTALLLTTTAPDVDEELLNRCLVLRVNEDRQQTRAIHRQQRFDATLEGQLERENRIRIRRRHQNAQRLLRELRVVNPYAKKLAFVDDCPRSRRDHAKYLTLIRTITLLHQAQRPARTKRVSDRQLEYLEVTLDDIAQANRLADQVLGRSTDELPPQTRRLLQDLTSMVRAACQENGIAPCEYRFSRRQVREQFAWGQTQLKVHLDRLQELEYVMATGSRARGFEYRLLYDGRGAAGQMTLCGLIDVEQLKAAEAPESSGSDGRSSGFNGPSSGLEGPSSGSDRPVIGP